MATKSLPVTIARRPRVDAQRNRERILEVARETFAERGPETRMDEIARRAEIGPGTLYRHFPTRDALIEAVFRSQVEKLTEAGKRLGATMRPLEALRAWMGVFIDYVAGKMLILPAMDTVPGGSSRMIEGSRGPVHGTFRDLVRHAIDSGELHAETDPDDMMRALIGVFHTTGIPGWEASARRIVDMLIDGSRATAKPKMKSRAR
jgi:AcrR family transcriptional regulator